MKWERNSLPSRISVKWQPRGFALVDASRWLYLLSFLRCGSCPGPWPRAVLEAVRGAFACRRRALRAPDNTQLHWLARGGCSSKSINIAWYPPSWVTTFLGKQPSLFVSAQILTCPHQRFLFFFVSIVFKMWFSSSGTGFSLDAFCCSWLKGLLSVHLDVLRSISEHVWYKAAKCKRPFKQQQKAFLCRQGQVLQAIASLIKWIRIQGPQILLGISSRVSP